ncbi:glutathione-dependent formaldehyde dehydrogenase [Candidatus Saccharibacteria bacterium]|nr:glutathione-dependent formaldehyde dehydrogenase [Candidatus Saccharibacteria bacterium]
MKAVTWQGKRSVTVEDVKDPEIIEPTDAIIKITSSAICGSDLHLYEVMEPFMEKGDILGHEPMGIVVETGPEVKNIKKGDRVVVPFNIACGQCFMCKQGLTTQCENTQVKQQNRGAALFGYTKLYGHIPGGQAELLRVPHADFMAKKVPEGPPDDRFLYLSDVLPTAWQAVKYANIPKGGSVVVLGLGPIGDMSTRIAKYQGAGQVIGVDLVPERLERAKANGVEVINWNDFEKDIQGLANEIRSRTKDGRGPDSVIDAVGMEAHGSPGVKTIQTMTTWLPDAVSEKIFTTAGMDRLNSLHSAIEIVRRGGTISIVGVYAGQADPIPMDTLFDKQIQVRMGQANAPYWTQEILPLLTEEDTFGVDEFATHHLSIDDAPHAYDIFQKKEDGAVKIVLKP